MWKTGVQRRGQGGVCVGWSGVSGLGWWGEECVRENVCLFVCVRERDAGVLERA